MNTLIEKLRNARIVLSLAKGKLKINAPAGVVTQDLLAEINTNKEFLVGYISKVLNKQKQESIPSAPKKKIYKLSSAQKRMFFLYQLDKLSVAYNMPQFVQLEENLPDTDKLQRVFNTLVTRHESLRTVFTIVDDEPFQHIAQAREVTIECFDAQHQADIDSICKAFVRPFDLSEGPLFRVGIVRQLHRPSTLLIDMHHIISDGISNTILMQEFQSMFYENKLLPANQLQYKDYAEWQNTAAQQQAIQEQGSYWLDMLGTDLPVLNLPLDNQRLHTPDANGGVIGVYLTPAQYDQLLSNCKKYNTTSSMLLYSIFGLLLSKLSGQEDLVVGLSIAGRNHPELENIVGLFVNSLPIRFNADRNQSFEQYVCAIREIILEAYNNQHFQFDYLVNKLGAQRQEGRNPIFDVMLNMEGKVDRQLDLELHPAGVYQHRPSAKRFDLTLNATEYQNSIYLQLQYDASLFLENTAILMLRCIVHLLSRAGDIRDKKLVAVDIENNERIEEIRSALSQYGTTDASSGDTAFPASYHQERLWFIDRFEKGYLYQYSPVYHNIPLILEMEGALNTDLLQKSIQSIIDKYEILRTSIITCNETPFQQIARGVEIALQGESFCGCNQDKQQWLNELINRPFELPGTLVRAGIAKTGSRAYTVVIVFHHIIADRHSVGVLAGEIMNNYQLLKKSMPLSTGAAVMSYRHFAAWQKERLSLLDAYFLSYWKQQLGGRLMPVELPLDRPRADIHTFTAGRQKFTLPAELVKKIIDYEAATHVPRGIIMMGAFKILLKKYTQQDEIIIGTSVNNRRNATSAPIIGPVDNLVALRSFIYSHQSFREYLDELLATFIKSSQYGEMPFDKLVKELAPAKDMSRTALFDILFQYADEQPIFQPDGLEVKIIETNLGYGKYDLNLLLHQSGETVEGEIVFNKDYLDEESVNSLLSHYCLLTENLVNNPNEKLARIETLSASEQADAIKALDYTDVVFPEDKTIVDLFCEQVAKNARKNCHYIFGPGDDL